VGNAVLVRRFSRDETASLAVLADRAVLLEAGYPTYRRGLECAEAGRVSSLRFTRGGVLTARVAGTRRYRVQVVLGEEPTFSCTCPLGEEGAVCTHGVAAVLAWLGVAA